MTHRRGQSGPVGPDNGGKLVSAANDALLRGFSTSSASNSVVVEDKMCALFGETGHYARVLLGECILSCI